MKELTREQFDAIRSDYPFDGSDEYVNWQYKETDTWPVKHKITGYEFVFCDYQTNKWYMGNFEKDYEWGIEDWGFPIKLTEVEKVEVKTFEWRKVKN